MAIVDEQLAREALAGSQSACRELVHRFERPVFNLIARMVRDPVLAEDLSQDAFVKAFNRLQTYRPEQGKFSNWLFKIAHNTAIDHLRRGTLDAVPLDAAGNDRSDSHALVADPDARTPFDETVQSDLSSALDSAIGRLRPEYREVVVLRHQEGLAYEEIVGITGLPLGTVKTYLYRARKEMAVHLTGAGWGPEPGGAVVMATAET